MKLKWRFWGPRATLGKADLAGVKRTSPSQWTVLSGVMLGYVERRAAAGDPEAAGLVQHFQVLMDAELVTEAARKTQMQAVANAGLGLIHARKRV